MSCDSWGMKRTEPAAFQFLRASRGLRSSNHRTVQQHRTQQVRRVGITSICLLCKLCLCAGHACDLRRPTSDAVPVPLTSHPIRTMAAYADTSTSLLRSLARQLAGMRGSGHPSHAALLDVRAAHPRSQLHVRTVGDKITVWGDEGDESASGLAGGGPTAESQTASDVDLQELKSSIAAIVREYLQSGYVRATPTAWFAA